LGGAPATPYLQGDKSSLCKNHSVQLFSDADHSPLLGRNTQPSLPPNLHAWAATQDYLNLGAITSCLRPYAAHFIGRLITQDSILHREPCGYTNQPTGVHHGHHNIGYLVGQHKIHEPFGIQILLVSIATLLCLVASILDNPGMHQYIITSLTTHLQTFYPFFPPSDDLSLAQPEHEGLATASSVGVKHLAIVGQAASVPYKHLQQVATAGTDPETQK